MVLRLPDSWSNWNLEMLVFKERGKPDYPDKNLSDQGREQTTLGIRVSQEEEQISLGISVFQAGEHITRDTFFPGGRTHITRDICVSQEEDYKSLGICVSQLGEHICLTGRENTYH